MIIIPQEKYKHYLTNCLKQPPSKVICECGKIVNVKYYPYCYDEENNDVYFGSICPQCGELIITRE